MTEEIPIRPKHSVRIYVAPDTVDELVTRAEDGESLDAVIRRALWGDGDTDDPERTNARIVDSDGRREPIDPTDEQYECPHCDLDRTLSWGQYQSHLRSDHGVEP